jgi:hypothetical protein
MKNCLNTFELKIKNTFLIFLLLGLPIVTAAQLKNIKNDVFWDTQNGTPIKDNNFVNNGSFEADRNKIWYYLIKCVSKKDIRVCANPNIFFT